MKSVILSAVQKYGNCSCISDVSTNTSDVGSSVVDGVCEVTSCYAWKLVIFFIFLFLAQILIFFCEIFHVSAMLRWNVHYILRFFLSVVTNVVYVNKKEIGLVMFFSSDDALTPEGSATNMHINILWVKFSDWAESLKILKENQQSLIPKVH